MADVVTSEVRSRMMSGIRAKNTRPEVLARRALHARGFRFRLHGKDLQGKPDIVLAKYRAVVFIHGCFWHGHTCPLFKWPSTRPEFWKSKIGRNIDNDARHRAALLAEGWRIATVWECALRGSVSGRDAAIDQLAEWLGTDRGELEIRG